MKKTLKKTTTKLSVSNLYRWMPPELDSNVKMLLIWGKGEDSTALKIEDKAVLEGFDYVH